MEHFLLAAGTTPENGSNPLWTFGPIILMFLVLYFLLIRPQQRRQKTRNSMLSTLKKGDKVVTVGGLHGVIMEMDDDAKTVVLRVNDTTKLTFDRSSVNAITQTTK
ncbi:preprotein translocase subunit YajC [Paenibacillus psychroresistens]|uniref:Preprotein translocase subunit YajC n=1 Tax=Paenibacillus psychroresistens TaxID=1778678 RepID=A0A6B8RH56_9BACL|nr:preprotein translocase subunit YajC [Paenibacillus psychroresistens]QGQ95419.1 preprotein translocase subunit YajC [Paenibacillus psychroresistens]